MNNAKYNSNSQGDDELDTDDEPDIKDEKYEYLYDTMCNVMEKHSTNYLILNSTMKQCLGTLEHHKNIFDTFHKDYINTCNTYNTSLTHICDSIASIKDRLINIEKEISTIKQQVTLISQLNRQFIDLRTFLMDQIKKRTEAEYDAQISNMQKEIATLRNDVVLLKKLQFPLTLRNFKN